MGGLQGQVAFITGAARGQGRSHARAFAAEGASVILVDRCADLPAVAYPLATEKDLAQTVEQVEDAGGEALSRVADVRDRAALQAVVDEGVARFGRLDIVVANAGVMPVRAPDVDEDEAWQVAVDVMLTGTWNTLKATVPAVVEGGRGGSIVLISSTAGLQGFPEAWGGFDGYTAAKHGVVGLMRSYAKTLAPLGIRVNTVHPTGVATPMVLNPAFADYLATRPELGPELENRLPGGLLEPSEVTAAVLYLVGAQGRSITGTTLTIDGGLTLP